MLLLVEYTQRLEHTTDARLSFIVHFELTLPSPYTDAYSAYAILPQYIFILLYKIKRQLLSKKLFEM